MNIDEMMALSDREMKETIASMSVRILDTETVQAKCMRIKICDI